MTTVKHPAKYTDSFMPIFAEMLSGRKNVLDPFGGTGKIFLVNDYLPDIKVYSVEIEPEWAAMDNRMIVGNALSLPFLNSSIDSVCTSPSYGNKMAGKISKDIGKGKWKRIKYADYLGRNLSEDNSANFVWGKKYREFHVSAWKECHRVLTDGGIFVLNIKNHISKGMEQFVTEWHIETLESLGFSSSEWKKIPVPSMKFGKYRESRVEYESIIKFILSKKEDFNESKAV